MCNFGPTTYDSEYRVGAPRGRWLIIHLHKSLYPRFLCAPLDCPAAAGLWAPVLDTGALVRDVLPRLLAAVGGAADGRRALQSSTSRAPSWLPRLRARSWGSQWSPATRPSSRRRSAPPRGLLPRLRQTFGRRRCLLLLPSLRGSRCCRRGCGARQSMRPGAATTPVLGAFPTASRSRASSRSRRDSTCACRAAMRSCRCEDRAEPGSTRRSS